MRRNDDGPKRDGKKEGREKGTKKEKMTRKEDNV